MPNCTFCGINIKKGIGKLFVYISGKTANFCSNKCEKNLLQLKRKPVRTKWTEEYRKEHKKLNKDQVEKKETKVPEIEKVVSEVEEKEVKEEKLQEKEEVKEVVSEENKTKKPENKSEEEKEGENQ